MQSLYRVVLALLLMLLANYAWAQAWPAKEIRLIVPYPEGVRLLPGGRFVFGTEAETRPQGGQFSHGIAASITIYLAERLKPALGQPVVPEYFPGDGGLRGNQAAFRASPDGYTLLYGDLATIVLSPALSPRLSFDPIKEFVPVTALGVRQYCLVAHPGLRAKSVKELLELDRAKEGGLTFSSPFTGSTPHLYAVMLTSAAGIRMSHVVHKGSLLAMKAVLEGQADATFYPCAILMGTKGTPHPLAVTGTERSAFYPNVPTLIESGYVVDVRDWVGIFAHAGTPKEIIERMAAEINKITTAPQGREFFSKAGIVLTGSITEKFADMIKSEAPRWVDAIRASGAKRNGPE